MNQMICSQVISAYLEQVSSEFETIQSEVGCTIVTPFVRPDGEEIELQLEVQGNDRVTISDMGDSVGYLYVNGLTLSKATMDKARSVSKGHRVTIERNELNVDVDPETIGDGVHRLIQSALAVTSLIQTRRPTTNVRFDDQVESLIIQSGAAYDIGYPVQGQRQRHTVKFHVDSGRDLLIHPVSAAQQSVAFSWAERLAYRFADIRAHSNRWRTAAILDDRGRRADVWTTRTLTPIQEYAIHWSESGKIEELIAS